MGRGGGGDESGVGGGIGDEVRLEDELGMEVGRTMDGK